MPNILYASPMPSGLQRTYTSDKITLEIPDYITKEQLIEAGKAYRKAIERVKKCEQAVGEAEDDLDEAEKELGKARAMLEQVAAEVD